MNAVTWMISGAIMSWLAFIILQVNSSRGLVVSVVIGAMSAYFGGSVLAPLLSSVPHTAGEFNPFGLATASAFAAACIVITGVVHDRFGV